MNKKKWLRVSAIKELTAKGFSIYVGNHGIDVRYLTAQFHLSWGASWDETVYYITTKRWMFSIG